MPTLDNYRDELLEAVDALHRGEVVLLRQLIVDWDAISRGDKTSLGQEFSTAVAEDEFPRLISVGRNAENHQQYRRI